jgi:hypothetical protein
MPNTFRSVPSPGVQDPPPNGPEDLPHGFIKPPEMVREFVAKEKARFGDYIFNAEAEERTLNDWTVQYYFESYWYEVLYRSTLHGPVVLAVGWDEIIAFTKDMPLGERGLLKTWMP